MSKAKKTQWGLRAGHPMQFRRTVTVGKGRNEERVTLVFEPNTPYELSDSEVAQLKPDIDKGMIVSWDEDKADFRQRLRPGDTPEPKPTQQSGAAEPTARPESDEDTAAAE